MVGVVSLPLCAPRDNATGASLASVATAEAAGIV